MGPDFYLSLGGLALVDSLNTSTLFLAILILLTARRPASTAWAYALGAIASFFTLAVVLYFAADAASAVVSELALWMRRVIFTLQLLTGLVTFQALAPLPGPIPSRPLRYPSGRRPDHPRSCHASCRSRALHVLSCRIWCDRPLPLTSRVSGRRRPG